MSYSSAQEVLDALKNAPKGQARQQILADLKNRSLIKSSGANVTLYCGDITGGKNFSEQFKNVYVGLISRLNAKTAEPDGIGALGGLSERTDKDYFNLLPDHKKHQLLDYKDDVILKDGNVVITDDINVIRKNNVIRETREELNNLGIYDYDIPFEKMQLVRMPDIKDDNFIINRWNGKGMAWAITPYCHLLKTQEDLLNRLVANSADINRHEHNSEAARFIKMPLFEALKNYGNYSGEFRLEDGRNAQSDYRYPHEWLATWYLASQLLNHNNAELLALKQELQAQTPWNITFKPAAQKMGKDLNFIADVLKVKPETIAAMENLNGNSVRLSKVQNFR